MKETSNSSKTKLPIIPIIVFALVVLATIGLYIYNIFLTQAIEEKNTEISKIDQGIKELQKEKDIEVYSLMKTNKSILAKLSKQSKITDYINHLEKFSRSHSITFSGFNLSDGKITTKASSTNQTKKILAYMNVEKFIKSYREDDTALFTLDFVNSFEGNETISFPLTFTIK